MSAVCRVALAPLAWAAADPVLWASGLTAREHAAALRFSHRGRRVEWLAGRKLVKHLVLEMFAGRARTADVGPAWPLISARSEAPIPAGRRAERTRCTANDRRFGEVDVEWVARDALLAHSIADQESVEVLPPHGARTGPPRLGGEYEHLALGVSITHAGEWVAAAVSCGLRVGVDLECVVPRRESFYPHYFGAHERRWVEIGGPGWRESLYTLLWTVKEGLLKARGTCAENVWHLGSVTLHPGRRAAEVIAAWPAQSTRTLDAFDFTTESATREASAYFTTVDAATMAPLLSVVLTSHIPTPLADLTTTARGRNVPDAQHALAANLRPALRAGAPAVWATTPSCPTAFLPGGFAL